MPRPTKEALASIHGLLDTITAEVAHLPEVAVNELLPLIRTAEREVARDLARWLAEAPDGAARYTAQHYRQALLQLRRGGDVLEQRRRRRPKWADDLQVGTERTFRRGGVRAGELATEHVIKEALAFSSAFRGLQLSVDVKTAAIIARGKRALVPQFRTSAARYAGGVWDDMKRQLSIGVLRGETFYQMTSRLQRLGGPRGIVATRGVLGEPGAVAEHISEGLFRRYRYWGERVVRTEMIGAYNAQAEDSIMGLADENPDEHVLKRWDARQDSRICPICRELDGQTAEPNGEFPGGYSSPPAHPSCRCATVAWIKRWND